MFVLAGILVWDNLCQPKPVTFESQEQASTPAGVEQAANAAHVPITPGQAAAIAAEIKGDADKPPDAVVQTIGARLEDTIVTELQKSGGQFAIITDPKSPAIAPILQTTTGKAVSSANAETISPNTPVALNQYNIKAYPDRLIQVGGSYQEVFAAYSWKVDVPKIPLIAPSGDVGYLGFYGHANLDRSDMSRVGIMLTIPK
jgi:hypothetical protein